MRWGRLMLAIGGIVLVVAGLLLLAPVAAAQAGERPRGASDFSAITTAPAAERLVREGRLVVIRLFPAELGGPADAPDTGYVTPEAARARALLIGTLERLRDEGVADRVSVEPDYRRESLVPTRIRFKAWHSNGGGMFEAVVEVW